MILLIAKEIDPLNTVIFSDFQQKEQQKPYMFIQEKNII